METVEIFRIAGIVFVIFGCFILIKNIRRMSNKELFTNYVETNVGANVLKQIFGEEKVDMLCYRVLLPFGALTSLISIGFGGYILFHTFQG